MKATTFLALAALSLGAPASAAGIEDLQLVYHATFANGSLESGVDTRNIGALTFGNSGEPGINPSWTATQGDYLITFTRPSSLTGQAVVVGIDATPVNFDVGSVVGLRGTFVAPVGPHNSADVSIQVLVQPFRSVVLELALTPLGRAFLRLCLTCPKRFMTRFSIQSTHNLSLLSC
jgi:hypothetical protein